MKRPRTTAALVWLIVFGAVLAYVHDSPERSNHIQTVYGAKLQSAFFSGFLTLSGFILALKTNILLRLQKDLFSDPEYRKRVENMSALDGVRHSPCAPLVELGTFLIWTVLGCLFASVTQITIGLIQTDWAVAACFAMVGGALVFVFLSWQAVRLNLIRWFELLEEKERGEFPKETRVE